MKRSAFILLGAISFLSVITACSDDDDLEEYPQYIEDLVCARTNSEGKITSIILDDGREYTPSQQINTAKKNATVRCRCSYIPGKDVIDVHFIEIIFSDAPQKGIPQTYDPVKFFGGWMSAGYLNLSIGIMTTNAGLHTLGFRTDSITVTDGMLKAHFSLAHKQSETDELSFTRNEYLSMPVSEYFFCDSIIFAVPTFEGLKILRFGNK